MKGKDGLKKALPAKVGQTGILQRVVYLVNPQDKSFGTVLEVGFFRNLHYSSHTALALLSIT
jgi:hypothetical protein